MPDPATQQCARIRTALEAAGTPMGGLDMMVPAHALAISAILVTHGRVFRRVKHLSIQDWTKP